MPLQMTRKEIQSEFRKNMAPGMVGIQTTSGDTRAILYEMEKERAKLVLKGTEAQNLMDKKPFISNLVKYSSDFPLTRWVLMFDATIETIWEIGQVLTSCKGKTLF
jgi:hypothetical protein